MISRRKSSGHGVGEFYSKKIEQDSIPLSESFSGYFIWKITNHHGESFEDYSLVFKNDLKISDLAIHTHNLEDTIRLHFGNSPEFGWSMLYTPGGQLSAIIDPKMIKTNIDIEESLRLVKEVKVDMKDPMPEAASPNPESSSFKIEEKGFETRLEFDRQKRPILIALVDKHHHAIKYPSELESAKRIIFWNQVQKLVHKVCGCKWINIRCNYGVWKRTRRLHIKIHVEEVHYRQIHDRFSKKDFSRKQLTDHKLHPGFGRRIASKKQRAQNQRSGGHYRGRRRWGGQGRGKMQASGSRGGRGKLIKK